MMALGKWTVEMRPAQRPTKYPGVKDTGDGTFRIRGKAKNVKTGELMHLDKIVEASSPLQASQLRIKLLAELTGQDRKQAQNRPTLKQHATSWLASKLPGLKPSTAELYTTLIDEYIVPGPIDDAGTKLGDCYVDAITLEDLVQWRDRQMAMPTKYGTLPAPATVNGRITKLKEIVRAAVHDLGLERDPTLRLEPVRGGKKRKNSLSADELHRFLQAAKQHTPQWYAFFYALAFTGLRFGELTLLRWRDIDEARLCVRVVGAQWKGLEDTTKTDDERELPLTPEFLGVLQAHRAQQLEALKRKARRERVVSYDAITISDDELIFRAPRSKKHQHMHNTAPRKALQKCLAKAGIDRRFTIHGHRHTFNNLLRQHTKDVVLVQSMTGHATVEMSENYSDVGLEEKRTAVEGLRLVVGGKGTP